MHCVRLYGCTVTEVSAPALLLTCGVKPRQFGCNSDAMKTPLLVLSLVGLCCSYSVGNIDKPGHTSPPSAGREAGLTSPHVESHANPPIPALAETTQIKGQQTTARNIKVVIT